MPSFCKSICFVAYVNHHKCEWIYRQVFYLQASHVPYHLTVKLMPTNVHRSHEISWKSAQCWLLRVTSQVSTGYLVTSYHPHPPKGQSLTLTIPRWATSKGDRHEETQGWKRTPWRGVLDHGHHLHHWNLHHSGPYLCIIYNSSWDPPLPAKPSRVPHLEV